MQHIPVAVAVLDFLVLFPMFIELSFANLKNRDTIAKDWDSTVSLLQFTKSVIYVIW